MAGTIENRQNTPKNEHQVKKLKALVAEMEIRAEEHLFRKVNWKLYVRFKPGQPRKTYSWLDWWLVEDYINRGMEDSFKRKHINCMRLDSIYFKMQECAENAQQIIVYDKRGKHKYKQDEVLISIVKGKVRIDKRPDSEKQLWPITNFLQ